MTLTSAFPIIIQLVMLVAFIGGQFVIIRTLQDSVKKLFSLIERHDERLGEHESRLNVQKERCELLHGHKS
jgi:hypothetical protein